MTRNRFVYASFAYADRDALMPHWEQRLSLRMKTMAETLRAMAAKKGRALVLPTLQYQECRAPTYAATTLVARVETAPMRGWRKKNQRCLMACRDELQRGPVPVSIPVTEGL